MFVPVKNTPHAGQRLGPPEVGFVVVPRLTPHFPQLSEYVGMPPPPPIPLKPGPPMPLIPLIPLIPAPPMPLIPPGIPPMPLMPEIPLMPAPGGVGNPPMPAPPMPAPPMPPGMPGPVAVPKMAIVGPGPFGPPPMPGPFSPPPTPGPFGPKPGCALPGDSPKPTASIVKMPTIANRTRNGDTVGVGMSVTGGEGPRSNKFR